jgi:PmbA protein
MDLLDRLMSESEQAEVVEIESELTTVGFEANRLKSSSVDETSGVAVRVLRGGRLGFSASSDPSAAEKLVTNALESAAYGDLLGLRFPGPAQALPVETFDETITNLPVSRLVEMGQEMLDVVLEAEPDAQVNIELQRGADRFSLRNSAGTQITFARSPLSIQLEVTRVRGDDVLILFDQMGVTLWEDEYLARMHDLADMLKLASRAATLRSGRMPVLFSPTGALALGLPLMLGLNGKNVYTRNSPMAGKIGEKLFDDKITVVDDATLHGRYGSAPYDDEGLAHRPLSLVQEGVLRSFFYDLKTAAQAGVDSTGNGSRGLFNPPSPSPTNLLIEAGETPMAEMLSSIKEGLLVEIPLGLGQGNVISGAFSNALGLAFKIENGEVVGRVKDVSIAGNIYELLQDVSAVSQETRWIYSNFRLPYILLPDMNVVAKE